MVRRISYLSYFLPSNTLKSLAREMSHSHPSLLNEGREHMPGIGRMAAR